MRSWPLLRQPPPDGPDSNVCARPGCDADTGSDAAAYCTETCQRKHAEAASHQPERNPAVPTPLNQTGSSE